MRSIQETIENLPSPWMIDLPAPSYYLPGNTDDRCKVGLAVVSMKDHITDEGWQIFQGLSSSGYNLQGYDLPMGRVDIPQILLDLNPSVVVMQDKREWDVTTRNFRDRNAMFTRVEVLASRPDIFKVTILKDAHQRPLYHCQSANEIGCNAWIVYYHPTIVKHLAPYVRLQHLIRTYHSIDSNLVPEYTNKDREGCLFSGAISSAYPLRQAILKMLPEFSDGFITYLPHPGYNRNGCCTPSFLQALSRFKVAICTSSIYGYALRKIVEATACGCVVITDLPDDEVLPGINNNLIRIPTPFVSTRYLTSVIETLLHIYSPERQKWFADVAMAYYDYRGVGRRLASDIEQMRLNYNRISHYSPLP